MCIFDRIVPIPQKTKLLDAPAVILGVPGKCFCSLEASTVNGDGLVAVAVAKVKETFSALLNAAPVSEG